LFLIGSTQLRRLERFFYSVERVYPFNSSSGRTRRAKVARATITTFSAMCRAPSFSEELNTKQKVKLTRSELHSWIITTSVCLSRSDREAYKSADVRASIRKNVSVGSNDSQQRRSKVTSNMILTFMWLLKHRNMHWE